MFVANAGCGPGQPQCYYSRPSSVTVYPTGSDRAERTISQGIAQASALAFDASGNLYVANKAANTVTVYSPGSDTVLKTLQGFDGPDALKFDAHGNLYVANYQGNTVSDVPIGRGKARTISDGVNAPKALQHCLHSVPGYNRPWLPQGQPGSGSDGADKRMLGPRSKV
ncbi:MAG TPA: hypothetical protein VGF86_15965 [Candidatus Tumulicola sp.]